MQSIIERITTTKSANNLMSDVMLAVPRITCGLALCFEFGSSKFGMPWSVSDSLPLFHASEWFAEDIDKFGGIFSLAPGFFAWMAAASETIGGLFLLLGLQTRIASFLIMCTMLVAIFFQKWNDGLWAMLPAMGFLWVSLYALINGSGRFGLDFVLHKYLKTKRTLKTPLKTLNKISSMFFILAFTSLMSMYSIAQEKVIRFEVDMSKEEVVSSVQLFGTEAPLSANEGYPLSDPNGDGIYEAEVRFETENKYVRVKFSNGIQRELQGYDSRVVWFEDDKVNKRFIFNEHEYYSKEQIAGITYDEQEIIEDVAVLKKIVQYIHPAIYTFRDSISLQVDFQALEKKMLASPDLVSCYKAISQCVAQIKCSHTFTNPWNQNLRIKKAIFYQPDKVPFTFQRIGKRLFIDKNVSENKMLKKGLEIKRINGVLVDTILTRLTSYVTSDGNNYEKRLDRLSLTGNEKYSFFDIFYALEFGSATSFELELFDLETNQVLTTEVKPITITDRKRKLSRLYENIEVSLRDGWKFEVLNENTATLSIKSFAVQRNEFDWKQFIDDALSEINQRSIKNLIIDLRDNEGGQGEVGEYIVQYVIQRPFEAPAMIGSSRYMIIPEDIKQYIGTWAKFPYDLTKAIDHSENGRHYFKDKYVVKQKTYKPKRNGFKGNVYLMINSTNSSATHILASYAKRIPEITLVGQATGGNQMGTNGAFMFFLNLPNTGIVVDIPIMNMVIDPQGGMIIDGGVQPDITVEKTAEDMLSGFDREINTVLEMIDKQ